MTLHPACDQPEYPPATISEDQGVRYLHLGTSWIQGAMRLRAPDAIELEYVRQMMAWMLFCPQPQHIVQLGLGSGALTKFCYRHFPDACVTAVELNPAVIEICTAMFGLPPNDARLNVRQMNAKDFVLDRSNHGTTDVLQIDLYDENAAGPVFDTPEFYQACADCLSADGIMTVNIFGNNGNHEKNLDALQPAFDAVVWLPPVDNENLVAIAFKRSPAIDFSTLYQRAADIRRKTNLRATPWVTGLQNWMQNGNPV